MLISRFDRLLEEDIGRNCTHTPPANRKRVLLSAVQTDRQPLVQMVTVVSPSGAKLFNCEVLTLGELRNFASISTGIEDPILTIQWSGKLLDHDDETVVSTVLMRGLHVVVHTWKTITEGV